MGDPAIKKSTPDILSIIGHGAAYTAMALVTVYAVGAIFYGQRFGYLIWTALPLLILAAGIGMYATGRWWRDN